MTAIKHVDELVRFIGDKPYCTIQWTRDGGYEIALHIQRQWIPQGPGFWMRMALLGRLVRMFVRSLAKLLWGWE